MIHSRMSTSTATAGSAITSFDPVSTRNGDNILPAGCTGVYGFTVSCGTNALTAAKSYQTRLRINAPNLGMNQEDILLGRLYGSGIATNDDGGFLAAEFIPWQAEGTADKFSLSTVNFYLAQAGVSSGNTAAAVVGPVSFTPKTGTGQLPPADWFAARNSRPYAGVIPSQGSASSNGVAFGTVVNSNTSLLTTKIRGEFHVVKDIMLTMVPGAVGTAGDLYVAWADFAGGGTTASGWAPQEWPFNTISPDLGTPVGTPIYGMACAMPAWAEKTTGDVTVDCLGNMIIAVTGAADGAYSLGLRR